MQHEGHGPEQTTLCRLVQQHAASCIAHTEASTGAELPHFVREEIDAFLDFGILAHVFLGFRCGECGHDELLAFSLPAKSSSNSRHLGAMERRTWS